MKQPAIVLLSGGLDSSTVLAWAIKADYDPLALSFDYGQRHRHELAASEAVAEYYGVPRIVMTLDLRQIGGSALTDDIQVAHDRDPAEMSSGIPDTYVPARNTILLSYALAIADKNGVLDILLGVNALDYSGYPDCRPEYITSFQNMARLGSRLSNLRISAPLVHMDKEEIVRLGSTLGVPFELTHSCYDPVTLSEGETLACGHCDSCILRRSGFERAGVPDPTRYAD